jgi:hypothetical protein
VAATGGTSLTEVHPARRRPQTLVRHARAAHVPLVDDQDAPLVSHPVEYLADRAVRDDLSERGQPDVRC